MTVKTKSARFAAALLVGASTLTIAHPAFAAGILYAADGNAQFAPDQRGTATGGIVQIKLDNGAIVSFSEGTQYQVNSDGSVVLYKGSATISGGSNRTKVTLPGGAQAVVAGMAGSAILKAEADGTIGGHVISGTATMGPAGQRPRSFGEGELFAMNPGAKPKQVVSNGANATPGANRPGANRPGASRPSRPNRPTRPDVVAMGNNAGPVAAAQNGLPVSLGDSLASAGASGDILGAAKRVEAAVANPSIETFPVGDLQALVEAAARLQNVYGGTSFPAAQADIIRTYLGFLASGNSGADFLTDYAGFLAQYLDLVRSGAAPSGFDGASVAQINSFITYLSRTGGLNDLNAQNAALVEAYLEFLSTGGNPDLFAGTFTGLTEAYFTFLRNGGVPADFAGASQETLNAYLTFLNDSGLLVQLDAADQALVAAFLDNGGIGFTTSFQSALSEYFDFLAAGNLPSDYTALDQATLQSYLAVLADTGLLQATLGAQAGFYADYLAFLQSGGSVDAFDGLPANIFTDYATALNAYFAFLENGGVPSAYDALSQETITAYLAALQTAQANDQFLGDLSQFYADYFAFLQTGGNPDNFAGLPVPPNFPAFADALNAYAAFLAAGGLPSEFTGFDLTLLADYLEAIENSGQINTLLGENGGLLDAYFAFLANGGAADGFNGLPIYANYLEAVEAYYAFVLAGGLPSNYTALDQDTLEAYLAALSNLNILQDELAGDELAFLNGYLAFVENGGDPDNFTGLPIYADYLAAVQAYYAFILSGGLPSNYTALDLATIEAYLAALSGLNLLENQLQGDAFTFLNDYLAFVSGGGNPDQFGGLPDLGDIPQALAGYSGGFDASRVNVNFQVTAETSNGSFSGGESGGTSSNYVIDANGGLVSYVREAGNSSRSAGTTTATDIFGNEDVLIGRLINGTATLPNSFSPNANQGVHYMLARQPGAPFVAPMSGRIDYYLVASTPATIEDGSLAPGVFDARMAIQFGTENLLGLEGSVTFGSDFARSFSTTGGVTNIDQSNVTVTPQQSGHFNAYVPGLIGETCDPDLCGFGLFASYAGDGTDTIGATYILYPALTDKNVGGAAIFAAGPTRVNGGDMGGGDMGGGDMGGGDMGGGNTGSGFTGTRDNEVYYTYTNGSLALGFGGSSDLVNGDLTGFTSILGVTESGATTIVESGDVGDLAWARWTNGDVVTTGVFGSTVSVGANGGYHVMSGNASFALPSSGTVNYDLIGTTSATDNHGSAPGTVTGDMAIAFGSTSFVGYDLSMEVGGMGWAVSTTGGAANPSQSGINLVSGSGGFTFGGSFTNTSNTVTASGNACASACFVSIGGAMFGSNAQYAGVAINVTDSGDGSGVTQATGLAIFGAPGAAGTSGASGQSLQAAGTQSQDWARFMQPLDASNTAPGLLENAAGIAPIVPTKAQAEEWMRGMISFDNPPANR